MSVLDLDLIAPEAVPGIRIMPVLHERVGLAPVVQRVLDEFAPEAVAVELPRTLSEASAKAVARLPKISAVISEEPGEDALVWIVTPGDPMVEAMRWAAEHGRETLLVDPDVRYSHRRHDHLPDPHSMLEIGAAHYFDVIRRLANSAPRDERDTLREKGIAHYLQQAAGHLSGTGTILCLVGAAHAVRVAEHLAGPTAEPLARQQRSRVLLRHLHPDSLTAVLPDPPLAHSVYELLRSGDIPTAPDLATTLSPRLELPLGVLTIVTGGKAEDRSKRAREVAAFAAHHGSRDTEDCGRVCDRAALGGVVWRIGAASHSEQTRAETAGWQRRLFFDFVGRYSRIRGQLVAGLYEWVVGARGVGDDNLAWEVFDVARCYPWQEREAELETARIDGDMLDLGTRAVRFRRRFMRVKQRPIAIPVRTRPSTDAPGEWLRAFTGDSICSYPPEDVVIEDWGRHIKRRAVSILSAERSHSEPFTTSMLDGIDLRETLLRLHEGRIWVREQGRDSGAVGSVVMVFDDDREGMSYPYLMSWLGEHEQESDMALYATDPLQQVVGPGIMRATYGGFMLSYPPGRLYNIWQDPEYRSARTKPEALLMAAVDYSVDKLVVHVGPHPPSSRIRDYAAARGRRIFHLPLGSLSPVSVRQIRVVHILAGRDKREIAKDYIW
jgi:hypothetical protein